MTRFNSDFFYCLFKLSIANPKRFKICTNMINRDIFVLASEYYRPYQLSSWVAIRIVPYIVIPFCTNVY